MVDGRWNWETGHDAEVEPGQSDVFSLPSEARSPLAINSLVVPPAQVSESKIRYEGLTGNQSIADKLMSSEDALPWTETMVRVLSCLEDGSDGGVVDSATLLRVTTFVNELEEHQVLGSWKSWTTVKDFLDSTTFYSGQARGGGDRTLGLGRFVCAPPSGRVEILAPPGGIHPSHSPHRHRILAETIVMASVFSVSGATACARTLNRVFRLLAEWKWLTSEVEPGVVISLLDHGRRRLSGADVPPNTVSSTVAMTSAYINNGIEPFEEMCGG